MGQHRRSAAPEPSTLLIPAHLNGPARSANGGIAAGLLAAFIPGPATVRLHRPPPLQRPLRIERDGTTLCAFDGDAVVLTAQPGDVGDLSVPPVDPDQASPVRPGEEHGAGTCAVCGPAHPRSLQVFPGPVDDQGTVAVVWTPPEWAGDDDGVVRPEMLWGVLDCPGGWAIAESAGGTFFPTLGTITVDQRAPVPVGEPVLVVGWLLGSEGRKHHAGTAVLGLDGRPRALGRQTCIAMPRDWAGASEATG